MSDSATAQASPRGATCLCGGIRLEMTGDPLLSAVCHCNNCKRTSGTSFQANIYFKTEQVNVFDEKQLLRTFVDSNTASGRTLERQFCGNCGSSITCTFANGTLRGVASGAIEDPTGWGPTVEFFCRDRTEWIPEFDGTERFHLSMTSAAPDV